ncbi:MAG: hypothetical protein JWL68_4721 [Actinomycetia bacterium]|nr:hypothetical protein [Actinomycetes bacterium]
MLYPVLAPALLVLTTLAIYALVTGLWGWRYGIIAAVLAGLVLRGDYGGLMDGRHPDLISAYFLITMGVAALIALYQSPSLRSAALVAVLGASPVLYHSVATLYAALLVALAAVTALPYLWYVGRRAEAQLVMLALVGLTLLAPGVRRGGALGGGRVSRPRRNSPASRPGSGAWPGAGWCSPGTGAGR